jgi:acetoin utilization deacetylase AcuC-like enzyme
LKTRNSIFIYSSELEKYHYPSEHPFNTVRAKRVRDTVSSMGLLSGTGRSEVAPVPAERVVLKKFHTARAEKSRRGTRGYRGAKNGYRQLGLPDF